MLGIRLLSQRVCGAVENPTGNCRFSEIGLYKFSRGGLSFLPKKKARPLSILRKRPAVPPFRRAKKQAGGIAAPGLKDAFFYKSPHAPGSRTYRGFVKKRMVACWANCPSTWHMPWFMASSVWDLAARRRASWA